ncbi:MAG: hypothetical protein KDC66_21935 [Phaeodactylibacter sp.]|nr:hypothetical protein [Phaeodactylibacter sp.]MCB9277210.1 hypothetical protein [Lewinellaceae bacterium]
MGHEWVEQLLERYFEGESSLTEEQQLREYFQRTDVPEQLRPYQPLFQYFAEEQAQNALGNDFDEKLLGQLQESAPRLTAIRRIGLRGWALRAAAIVLLGLGLGWLFFPKTTAPAQTAGIDWAQYEVQDPQQAFRITTAALLKTSGELNRGTSTAARELKNLGQMGKFFK